MFSVKWIGARGLNRGKPGLPGGHGRRLAAFAILMAATVLQTGCQSGPFSSCGSCGTSGIIARTTSFITRPFHRNKVAAACCGSEVVSDGGCISSGVPVEAGAPVIMPGATVIPGAATPSNVLPPDTPSSLEALPPRASPGPAPSGAMRSLPAVPGNKTSSSYETYRPDSRSGRSRNDNLAHTLISTPVPATRSAQDIARAKPRDGDQPGSESVLDHLPPLDLPAEVSEKTATPPVAPAVERKPQSPAPASDHLSGRSSSEPDASPSPEIAASPGGTPGIARFVAVDLKLAGGSTPSTAGLNWLADKGYKTLVDLRDPSETDAAFIAEATRRGLRYIALPVNLKSIDKTHASRFNFELALSDARPLYFFDTDGTRAGTLWYIRRITLDRVNSQIARREAEELGLNNPDYWTAAIRFLERPENTGSQVSENAGTAGPSSSAKAVRPSASSASGPKA